MAATEATAGIAVGKVDNYAHILGKQRMRV